MLTLLTGSDRTALSRRLHQHLAKAVEAGEMGQILLVPEQFSHEAERILLEVGGSSVSRYAEVLSLKRLADRVAASCGGAARAYLDKGGRLLNMASAAEQVSRGEQPPPAAQKPSLGCNIKWKVPGASA